MSSERPNRWYPDSAGSLIPAVGGMWSAPGQNPPSERDLVADVARNVESRLPEGWEVASVLEPATPGPDALLTITAPDGAAGLIPSWRRRANLDPRSALLALEQLRTYRDWLSLDEPTPVRRTWSFPRSSRGARRNSSRRPAPRSQTRPGTYASAPTGRRYLSSRAGRRRTRGAKAACAKRRRCAVFPRRVSSARCATGDRP